MIRLKKQENIGFLQRDLTGTTPARRRLLKLRINTQRKEARDDSEKRIERISRKKTISKPQIKIKMLKLKVKLLFANCSFVWQRIFFH